MINEFLIRDVSIRTHNPKTRVLNFMEVISVVLIAGLGVFGSVLRAPLIIQLYKLFYQVNLKFA